MNDDRGFLGYSRQCRKRSDPFAAHIMRRTHDHYKDEAVSARWGVMMGRLIPGYNWGVNKIMQYGSG